MTRTRLVRAAAVFALAPAALLAVLAVDLVRWERSLAEQDVRFYASPQGARFSEPAALLPLGIAERVLGGKDDLAFRGQLQGFARVRPGATNNLTDQYLRLRGETQLGLALLSRADRDPARRSRAANMIGVVALDNRLAPQDPEALADLINGAISSFRNAVEIDPSNADAKFNLEQALRIPGFHTLPGDDPTGTRDAGDVAGLGGGGSGY
jgi:hypothetical protein